MDVVHLCLLVTIDALVAARHHMDCLALLDTCGLVARVARLHAGAAAAALRRTLREFFYRGVTGV